VTGGGSRGVVSRNSAIYASLMLAEFLELTTRHFRNTRLKKTSPGGQGIEGCPDGSAWEKITIALLWFGGRAVS
jgi:hypothetical protein